LPGYFKGRPDWMSGRPFCVIRLAPRTTRKEREWIRVKLSGIPGKPSAATFESCPPPGQAVRCSGLYEPKWSSWMFQYPSGFLENWMFLVGYWKLDFSPGWCSDCRMPIWIQRVAY